MTSNHDVEFKWCLISEQEALLRRHEFGVIKDIDVPIRPIVHHNHPPGTQCSIYCPMFLFDHGI